MKTKTMAIASLVALSVSAPAFAAKEAAANKSAKESKSIIQQLKDSPFSLTADLETVTDSKVETYNGSSLTGYLSYKLSDTEKIKSMVSMDNSKNGDEFENSFSSAYIGYQKGGLFKDNKLGLSINAQARLYKYNEATKNSASRDGKAHARLTLVKKVSDKVTVAGLGMYNEYIRTSGKDSVTRRNATALVSTSYGHSDKLSFINDISVTGSYKKNSESYSVGLTPQISYAVNDTLATTLYYSTTLMKSNDGQLFAKNWLENGVIALNLSYSVF
ncbi:hypothetical protein OAK75_01360 [Bacteriovoracales bacterium]|nr:hypothetical protein [Bacteriovoracales bacterium]